MLLEVFLWSRQRANRRSWQSIIRTFSELTLIGRCHEPVHYAARPGANTLDLIQYEVRVRRTSIVYEVQWGTGSHNRSLPNGRRPATRGLKVNLPALDRLLFYYQKCFCSHFNCAKNVPGSCPWLSPAVLHYRTSAIREIEAGCRLEVPIGISEKLGHNG